jgi:hypothetical protein
MMTTVDLRCTCGAVQGHVLDASPKTINRVVCYCDDCQAFVRFLGREDIMDAQGGTDIVQIAPSRIRLTQGTDKLRSMRLSDKGVLRWYTDCCKTPAGNMLDSAKCPFAGIATQMFVLQGSDLDAAVGTPIGRIWGKFAIGGCPPGVDEGAGFGLLLQCMKFLLGNIVMGRHKPSPYWTSDQKPKAEPLILVAGESAKYYRA